MEIIEGVNTVYCTSSADWRDWLEKNHPNISFVWLIIYRKNSDTPSVQYSEAVDQALCFGWIDSAPRKRNDQSYYLYMSVRNPASNWSKVNKEKVAKLRKLGQMHASGEAVIQRAIKNGRWDALNEVSELIVPDDLLIALNRNSESKKNWDNFSKSSRRGILECIFNAKRQETRQKRIEETVSLASQGIKANHPKGK